MDETHHLTDGLSQVDIAWVPSAVGSRLVKTADGQTLVQLWVAHPAGLTTVLFDKRHAKQVAQGILEACAAPVPKSPRSLPKSIKKAGGS